MTLLDVKVKRKPVVDEAGFEQVLAAAYVLQQHNDSLRAKDPRLDTAWILTQVAETQSLLLAGNLRLEASSQFIADRLRTMTASAGVSISLTRDGYLHRVAEAGAAAKVPGSSIASHSLVATERLKNGRPFQSADAQRDIRLDIPGCRELGVRALLAVPVLRSGKIAGLVEVRWNKPDAFHECDVRTCQLMAALVTDVLEIKGDAWHGPVAMAQTSSVHSAFELAADEEPVGKVPDAEGEAGPATDRPASDPENPPAPGSAAKNSAVDSVSASKRPSDVLASKCRVCGRPFLANEAFCGNCSMPRVAGAAAENLQSKWASLWYMQQAQETIEERVVSAPSHSAADPAELHALEEVAPQGGDGEPAASVWRRPEKMDAAAGADLRSLDADARNPQFLTRPSIPDASAESAPIQDVLIDEGNQLGAISPVSWDDAIRSGWVRARKAFRRRIGRRVALASMASLALFLFLVIWAWPSPASHLTWFESLLVKVGIAEVPQRAPVAPTGNPDVQVWVDVHTGLYYCPASDLYGKTPDGKYATQREAQLDKFESATRAFCE